MRTLLVALAIVALGSLPSLRPAAEGAPADAAAHAAHDAYVKAINSNDLETIMGMLTEDVVFLAAHEKPYVGKSAVRPWVKGYLDAFKTQWEKTNLEFVVAGEWAFERYSYKSTDTPRAGGAAIEDTGWGLVIYRREGDGKWRVARDAWGSDRPLAAK